MALIHLARRRGLWPRCLHTAGIASMAAPESMPRHVAFVPDGNRRWAQERGLSTAEGHEAGRRALEQTIRLSRAWGVRAVTVFACSQENLARPKASPLIPFSQLLTGIR